MRPSSSRAGLPAPEQPPALSMPPNDCVRRHERQVLAPAGSPSASQDSEQLVPRAKVERAVGFESAGKHRQLMAQEQVLEHEVAGAPKPGRS